MRRRGLVRSAARTAGRTALIAGTATAVSNRVANRQNAREVHARVQGAEAADHQTSHPGGNDLVGLHQLADLKAMGALSEKEFAAAKSRLLKEE